MIEGLGDDWNPSPGQKSLQLTGLVDVSLQKGTQEANQQKLLSCLRQITEHRGDEVGEAVVQVRGILR